LESSLEIEKSKQACEILKELNLDAWMVWVRETSQMADPVLGLILGGDLVWQSALIYTKDGRKIGIVGNMDADGIKAKSIFDEVIPYTKSIKEPLLEVLNKISPTSIGINFSTDDVAADGLSLGMYKILKKYLGDTPYANRLTSAEALVTRLRSRKTETEISRITKAVQITEEIFASIEQKLKVGLTELEIYDYFHQAMNAHGVPSAWNPDHNPAVDAGPNKGFGHAGPTENKTKAGHLLHFDFGVKYSGYCSDIQRMFFFGKLSDVPEEVTAAFEAVRDTIQGSADMIKPGVKGVDVDTFARDFVKERGYEEYQHALGHQLGLQAHDGGTLLGPLWERYGNTPNGILEPNNVFTLELYVTTENYGQVSLEEDIVITKDGCKFLSTPQRELKCIDR